MTHTPTPWQRSGVRRKLGDEDCIAIGPDGFAIAFLPIGRRPQEQAGAIADAAHIVRCVNAHDELVAMLEAARREIAYHKHLGRVTNEALLTHIDDALAKVSA